MTTSAELIEIKNQINEKMNRKIEKLTKIEEKEERIIKKSSILIHYNKKQNMKLIIMKYFVKFLMQIK